MVREEPFMYSKSEIVVNKEQNELQIFINEPVIIKVKNIKSNQKMLLPLSQNIFTLTGKKLFTLQKVSNSLAIGKCNRQNVSNQVEKFNNIFEGNYKKYLNNQKELDIDMQNLINEIMTQNIFTTNKELIKKIICSAKKRFEKNLSVNMR